MGFVTEDFPLLAGRAGSIQRSEGGSRLTQCPRAERIEYEDILAVKATHVAELGTLLRSKVLGQATL
jgi:hypothetical protein